MSALACALRKRKDTREDSIQCQSIMSALACALEIARTSLRAVVRCQSIMSALACALISHKRYLE